MYNINMSTVIVKGPERAIEAGTWAENNLKNEWSFNLNSSNPFSKEYEFRFSNARDATLFALKWVN